MTVSEILRKEYRIEGKPGQKVECPDCHKKTFSIKKDDLVGKCFRPSCGRCITASHNRGGTLTPPEKTATVQPGNGLTLEQYAEAKKLPIEFLQKLGLRTFLYMNQSAVRIPYKDRDDSEIAVRFRLELEKDEECDNRFRWRSGDKVSPYGLWRLETAQKEGHIAIVEGESDAQTLWFHKIPALGIPGANSWKDAWAEYVNDIPVIYVVVEPDSGGEAVAKWLSRAPFRERVRLIDFKDAKDPSNLYLADPERFPEAWQSATEGAVTWTDFQKKRADVKRQEAWEKCAPLAQERSILDVFVADITSRGLVGEERAVKLIYLATTSRVLPKPISLAIKGPSSAGKSFVVQRALEFFPESAYYALTGMSEHNLAYSKEPLSHRILVIYEHAGIQGDFGAFIVRSLLSEGHVRYETVVKTLEGMESVLIEREGPTGLFITTTEIKLHPETETRLLSIPVTDTSEQTKSVMLALANEDDTAMDLTRWKALQEWIASCDNRVVVPYATDLAKFILPVAVRLRRDFSVLLSLIKSHAILHQATRERDNRGRIIATIEDYRVVRNLVYNLMAEGVESVVSKTIRETVEAVQKLSESNSDGVTNARVAQELNLGKSSAYRRVKSALERGYLKNEEEKRGRPAKLLVDEPIPDDVELLPTVEKLHGCMVAGQTGGIEVPPSTAVEGYKTKEKAQDELFDLPQNINDWPEAQREAYEERAAIMQANGKISQEDAEKFAEASTREAFKRAQS